MQVDLLPPTIPAGVLRHGRKELIAASLKRTQAELRQAEQEYHEHPFLCVEHRHMSAETLADAERSLDRVSERQQELRDKISRLQAAFKEARNVA